MKTLLEKREMKKKWRLANMEKWRGYQKKAREKIRKEVLKHYSGDVPKCACCGEIEIKFLAIDHINGGGTKERKMLKKGAGSFYYYLKKMKYPPRYQVLCHNCNSAKSYYGKCPHQKKNQP